jgi:hypothetical protein
MGDGYGAFETEITISGTVAGYASASSTWVNLAAGTVAGANMITTRNDGIYAPTGLTLTNTKMVLGGRLQCVIDDGANPGGIFLWSTNIYDNALTAFFDVNVKVDVGWVDGVLSNATGDGHVPLFKEADGTVHYVNTFVS